MRFTWLTYKLAIRRSLKRANQLWDANFLPEWSKQQAVTARLERRQDEKRWAA